MGKLKVGHEKHLPYSSEVFPGAPGGPEEDLVLGRLGPRDALTVLQYIDKKWDIIDLVSCILRHLFAHLFILFRTTYLL